MLAKTSFLLIFVALFLGACQEGAVVTGTALPTVTETREGVVAAATPTLPISTPIPPTPTFTLTPTPSRTPHPTVPPHPTNTPTLPPQTATPTLPPITPLPSPADYQLRPWSEQDTLNLLNIITRLNDQWIQFTEENEWRMPGWGEMYSWIHRQLAWFKQEIVWHNPEINNRVELEWEIALDLALAGEQEASLHLTSLLEQSFNSQGLNEPDASFLRTKGFIFDLMTVENLFGNNQKGWILVLSQNQSPYSNEVGAAFSIQQTELNYSVSLINSFWLPYHGYGFTITVGEHTDDNFPEVVVDRKMSIGTGPPFSYSDICIYQWDENKWQSILNDSDNKPCIRHWEPASDPFPLQYTFDGISNIEQVEITSTINPGAWPYCEWTERHRYSWNGIAYVLENSSFDLPTQLEHPEEISCLELVWGKTIQPGDAAKMITLMENILNDWPEPDDLDYVLIDALLYETEFPWIFRFQLGRYHALTGDLVKAESFLAEVASQPLSNFESPWPTRAQIYLDNLDDVEQAEMLLAEFNQSIVSVQPLPPWINVEQVSFELANRLFAGESPQTIITELETLIAEHCTENRYCVRPYYVFGLAYEAAGDEANAVAAYWQVWHDYPDSYYATIAQYRLVEKE